MNGFPAVSTWPTNLKQLYNAHHHKTIRVYSGQIHLGGKSGAATSMPITNRDLATSDAAYNLTVLDVLSRLRAQMQAKRVLTTSGGSTPIPAVNCTTAADVLREKDMDEIFLTFILDEFEVCCGPLGHLLYKVEKDVLNITAAPAGGTTGGGVKKTIKMAASKTKTEDDYSYVYANAQYAKQLPVEYLLRFLALLPSALDHYRRLNQTYDHNFYLADVEKIKAMVSGLGGALVGSGGKSGGGFAPRANEQVLKSWPVPQVGVKRGRDGRMIVGDGVNAVGQEAGDDLASLLKPSASSSGTTNSSSIKPQRASPPPPGAPAGSLTAEETLPVQRQQSLPPGSGGVVTTDEALFAVHQQFPHCLVGSRMESDAWDHRGELMLQLLSSIIPKK